MTNKRSHKKLFISLIAMLFIVAIAYVVVKALPNNSDKKNTGNTSRIDPVAEQNRIDEQKSGDTNQTNNDQTNNSDTSQQNTDDSSAKNTVSVIITSTKAYIDSESASLNGYVADVVEKDGICTLTMTDTSGKVVKASRPAEADATTTTCGQSSIALSSLHPGKWSAVLSYNSSTSSGKSNPTTVTIP